MFSLSYPLEGNHLYIFTPTPGYGTPNEIYSWYKPDGIQWIYFLLIGAGGPGGNGATGASGTARGGGGGGGGGGVVSAIVPSFLVPGTLYVKPGSSNSFASTGDTTSIELYKSTYYPFLQAVGGNAGGNASGTTAGAAAVAAGAFALSTMALGSFGMVNIQNAGGTTGTIGGGGVTTAPGNLTVPDTSIVTGGAGGAGITTLNAGNTGGTLLKSDITPQINGGAANAANPGGNGTFLFKPFLFGLGGGGGASNNGTAGNGGVGGYGCGGGGGGGGTTAGTGGRGGDGIVIIKCW